MNTRAAVAFSRSTPESFNIPDSFTPAYTHEDQRSVVAIIEWINASLLSADESQRWTKSRLAKASGVKESRLNQVLGGKYPSPPTEALAAMTSVIDRHEYKSTADIRPVPYCETTVHKRVFSVCHRAHIYKNFGVVSGEVGIGKTSSLMHYAEQNSNVFYIRAMQSMSVSVLLDELIQATGATVHKSSQHGRGTEAERLAGCRRKLEGQDALIILDEADRVSANTLETLRYLRDVAKIGVVLAGNQGLFHTLKDSRGRFGQISSRVGFWPATMNAITEKDAEIILRAAFADFGWDEPTADIVNAFWQICDGSARVLAENIIPAVRDFIVRKNIPLSPELILQAGQEILGLSKRGARK